MPVTPKLLCASVLMLGLGALPGCPRPIQTATAPCPPPSPVRLIEQDGSLFLTSVPEGYRPGSLFYVLDRTPLPGSCQPQRLAIAESVESQAPGVHRVTLACPLPPGKRIPDGGLPGEGVSANTEARLGRCFGRYLGGEVSVCGAASVIDLPIELGQAHGVQPGDVYEVLGTAQTDATNRTILDFERLGLCTIQPSGLSPFRATCRLDRRAPGSQRFDPSHCLQGGFVHQRNPGP